MVLQHQHQGTATQVGEDAFEHRLELTEYPSDLSHGEPSQADQDDTVAAAIATGIPGLPTGDYEVQVERTELIIDVAIGPLILLIIRMILKGLHP